LKNLTIIEDTLAKIYKVQDKKIDIENIPLDDKETYKSLQRGETIGVFQLESEGLRRYLKQLKPNELEDIIAMVALYRPGPMQFIPDYIAGKQKKKRIEYLHPKLKPILESTYGVCIYQEQLMQIARDLAGFSLSEADVLRKAVGKKIKSLLLEQKEKLITGMMKNGIEKEIAQKIWEWILPFARYGFNRSHSCAYALIAYQTAYLKTQFPVEFMASLLTSEQADVERIGFLIGECKRMEVEVLPPDINESWRNFTAIPGKKQIRFGFLAIKNVGVNFVEAIVRERKLNGPFKSIEDFILRIKSKDLNKKSFESLIKAGAFDKFAERNLLLYNLERFLEFNRESQREKFIGQKGLFDKISLKCKIQLKKTRPATKSEKLAWEKELLGLFVSSHPLDDFRHIFEKKITKISELNSNSNKNNGQVKIGGIISRIKKIITRNGRPMLFMNLEDLSDKIEIVVFPSVIERNPTAFQENKIVFVSGKLDHRDGVPKVICENIEEIVEG
jgi:DNA polymerase-3 subunit alpha